MKILVEVLDKNKLNNSLILNDTHLKIKWIFCKNGLKENKIRIHNTVYVNYLIDLDNLTFNEIEDNDTPFYIVNLKNHLYFSFKFGDNPYIGLDLLLKDEVLKSKLNILINGEII